MKFLTPRNANLTLNLIKNKTHFQYVSIFSGFFEVFVVHFVQMRILGLCCCQMEEPDQCTQMVPLLICEVPHRRSKSVWIVRGVKASQLTIHWVVGSGWSNHFRLADLWPIYGNKCSIFMYFGCFGIFRMAKQVAVGMLVVKWGWTRSSFRYRAELRPRCAYRWQIVCFSMCFSRDT